MEIKEERLVTWAEAKNILLKKEKEKELGYEQRNALEHLRKFANLSESKAKEMAEELKKIEKLREKHIVNLVNLLPQDEEELRLIFANEIITLTDEEKKTILDVVKKFTS